PSLTYSFSQRADHRNLHSFPTRRSSDLSVTLSEAKGSVSVAKHQPLRGVYPERSRRAQGDNSSSSSGRRPPGSILARPELHRFGVPDDVPRSRIRFEYSAGLLRDRPEVAEHPRLRSVLDRQVEFRAR